MAQLLHPGNWSIKIHGNKLREYMTHAQWCSIVKVRLILAYVYEEGLELWTYNNKNTIMRLKMHIDNKLFCNRFFLKQQLEGDKKKKDKESKLWCVYYLTLNICRFCNILDNRILVFDLIIYRWASRLVTNVISIDLSNLTDQYTLSSSNMTFISLFFFSIITTHEILD
jgi:hypothetical protein